MLHIGIDIANGEESPHKLFLALQEYLEGTSSETLHVFVPAASFEESPEFYQESAFLKIYPVTQIIDMEDNPIKSVGKKQDSAIVRGLHMLKDGDLDFFFSPGNTGAVVYGALQIIGLIKNLHAPALGVLIPNIHGDVLLLDAGASPLIDEDRGLDLAVMGKIYYENYFNQKHAKVGVLNLGKEWHKGSKWVRKLGSMLKKDYQIDYFGFVEGFDLFVSQCQVFVTGGYTGNILIKALEGMYSFLKHKLSTGNEKLTELIRGQIHYSRVGAALLLGFTKDIFVGHGITGPEALKNALIFAKEINKLKLGEKIEQEIRNRSFISKLIRRRRDI